MFLITEIAPTSSFIIVAKLIGKKQTLNTDNDETTPGKSKLIIKFSKIDIEMQDVADSNAYKPPVINK